jgi:hypothetical protein
MFNHLVAQFSSLGDPSTIAQVFFPGFGNDQQVHIKIF